MKLIGFWTKKYITLKNSIAYQVKQANRINKQIVRHNLKLDDLRRKQARILDNLIVTEEHKEIALKKARHEKSHHHVSIFEDI